MHELSLFVDLLRKIEKVAEEQGAERVVRVRVALGALSHLSPEHFAEHFLGLTEGTVAEGAEFDIRVLDDIHDPHAQEVILESLDVEIGFTTVRA
jgi:hydrogenase nickel incorporation protein HypA/HybF